MTSSATAYAGTWTFSAAGSSCVVNGSSYNTTDNPAPTWSPPADTTGAMSLSFPGAAAHGKNFKGAPVCNCGVAASLTIKVTWVPNPALGAASDPAPPSLWLVENSSASWTGSGSPATALPTNPGDPAPPAPQPYTWNASASDGLGDAEVDPDPNDKDSDDPVHYKHPYSGISSTATAPVTMPRAGWKKYTPDANGVITLSHGISATASVNAIASGAADATSAIAYSVSIHATPYAWRINLVGNDGHGLLYFGYDWKSTTGNVADLTTCYAHERVTYPSLQDHYVAPTPFDQDLIVANPTIKPGLGTNGGVMTSTSNVIDRQIYWTTVTPFSEGSFTASQRYEYDDTATGDANLLIPSFTGDSEATIQRIVTQRSDGSWWYTVTKSGYSAEWQLQ